MSRVMVITFFSIRIHHHNVHLLDHHPGKFQIMTKEDTSYSGRRKDLPVGHPTMSLIHRPINLPLLPLLPLLLLLLSLGGFLRFCAEDLRWIHGNVMLEKCELEVQALTANVRSKLLSLELGKCLLLFLIVPIRQILILPLPLITLLIIHGTFSIDDALVCPLNLSISSR